MFLSKPYFTNLSDAHYFNKVVPVLTIGGSTSNDPEGASLSTGSLLHDPFQFQNGLVPDEDLAGLRNRKKGKDVAKYQVEQNTVSLFLYAGLFHVSDIFVL